MTTLKKQILELGADSSTLDSIVDEGASRQASRINNEGMPEQLRYLENEVGMSEEEILEAVKSELG